MENFSLSKTLPRRTHRMCFLLSCRMVLKEIFHLLLFSLLFPSFLLKENWFVFFSSFFFFLILCSQLFFFLHFIVVLRYFALLIHLKANSFNKKDLNFAFFITNCFFIHSKHRKRKKVREEHKHTWKDVVRWKGISFRVFFSAHFDSRNVTAMNNLCERALFQCVSMLAKEYEMSVIRKGEEKQQIKLIASRTLTFSMWWSTE